MYVSYSALNVYFLRHKILSSSLLKYASKNCNYQCWLRTCNYLSNRTSWFVFHIFSGACSNSLISARPYAVCQSPPAVLRQACEIFRAYSDSHTSAKSDQREQVRQKSRDLLWNLKKGNFQTWKGFVPQQTPIRFCKSCGKSHRWCVAAEDEE